MILVENLLPFVNARTPPCRYSAGVSGLALAVKLEFHDTLLAILRVVVYDARDDPLDPSRPVGLVVCKARSERPRNKPI